MAAPPMMPLALKKHPTLMVVMASKFLATSLTIVVETDANSRNARRQWQYASTVVIGSGGGDGRRNSNSHWSWRQFTFE